MGYFTERNDFADVIKLRILKWDYCLIFDYLCGRNLITWPLKIENYSQPRLEEGWSQKCNGFEPGRRGHQPRNKDHLWKMGKARKWFLLSSSRKEPIPAAILILVW
jgi:hypothetical protein